MEPDSNPDTAEPAPDIDPDGFRRTLDAQARAWAGTTRKWIWLVSLAVLTAAAAGVGFLFY